jgi:type I restriction enzyme, S subunit
VGLPKHWSEVNLFDLCKPKQWKTIAVKNLTKDGYVVYGANGKIGFFSTYTHENPTLMITCRGASCGNVHISEPLAYINGNAMALDELSLYVDLKFMYYYLRSRDFNDVISGSAQPQITQEGIKVINVPLPPLNEQKRIAKKLDELLATVESIKTRLDNAPTIIKRFRQSILSAATSGDLTSEWREENGIIDEWENIYLENIIIDRPRNGYSPKGVDYETPIKNLTLSATTSSVFKDNCYKYVDIEVDDDSHLWINNGDILIQRANSLEYVGVSAIYKGISKKYIYPDLMMKVIANRDFIITKYLHYSLLSMNTRQYFRTNTTGTAGNMPKINQKVVMKTPIQLPSLLEQKEIVSQVESLFALADTLEEKIEAAKKRVDKLTQSILAKAFRGELVEQDPNDKSAEKLLEKIKNEG